MTLLENIESLKAEGAKATADIAERDAAIAAKDAELVTAAEAFKALDVGSKKLLTERDEALAAGAKAVEDCNAKQTELDTASAALAEATGKLRNPAIAAACVTESDPVPSGADATAIKTREQLESEYAAIPSDTLEGAQTRAIFRETNKAELGL